MKPEKDGKVKKMSEKHSMKPEREGKHRMKLEKEGKVKKMSEKHSMKSEREGKVKKMFIKQLTTRLVYLRVVFMPHIK
ncbi:hypothetical protein ACE6H2_020541 [Prunus campanulata]